LLLRLGPTGKVIKWPDGLGMELRSEAAQRILALYGV